MTKTSILLIAALSIISCKAQTIYPLGTHDMVESKYYVKDIDEHHNDIVGTWRWENENSSFEIVLQEFEMFHYPNKSTAYYDVVFGKYTYVENGEVIASVQQIQPIPNSKLTLHFSEELSYKVVIEDVVSETSKVGEFVLVSSNTATMNLWNSNGVKINYGNGLAWALPESVMLIKQ
ncbi:DUF6705 family protein [Aureitalea marina]|uniref:DUF6705 domain-containing protein n=1 Tax=Aureitalea marina TaxID=930804 RepID=A0A2S7KRW5_9FLAO|nr:DUF6705 family protein [Aureitalea marina]PQB05372.1 hypothetical protein BST85_11095 [Aureitalea marina]